MTSLTIGEVAKQAFVGPETIRFYEREGLLDRPPRRPSGYRAYPPETVQRLRFIRSAKGLGFSLTEIRQLLRLRVHPVKSCTGAMNLAKGHAADIDERIRRLQSIRRTLHKLIRACEAREPTSECPILESLDWESRR